MSMENLAPSVFAPCKPLLLARKIPLSLARRFLQGRVRALFSRVFSLHFDDVCYIVHPALDFVVTTVQRVVVYVYELVNGEVKVDKIDFRKPQAHMNESC